MSGESELATILEGIGEGFYAVDRDWRITHFNSEASRHFRRSAADMVGHVLWEIFPTAAATDLGRTFLSTMASRATVRGESMSVLVGPRWLAYRLFPLGDGMGIVFRDVTELKHAEAHRELLINELNHRVKNTLATVMAITSQSLKNATSMEQGREAIAHRLIALGRAHDLLLQTSWTSASLSAVVRAAIDPFYTPGAKRFIVQGAEIDVGPAAVLSLALALNELCTNAVKFGALSNAEGHVEITSVLDEKAQRFKLIWAEKGGPAVKEPPKHGFGTQLIERSLARLLHGDARLRFEPSGVICEFDFPLASLRSR